MILKALYDYYQRCKNLPPEGMEYKEIHFIIVLDKEGRFLRFEDRRDDKKGAQRFLVAKSKTRSSAPVPNVLWDNFGYVLGLGEKKEKQHAAFREMIYQMAERFTHSTEMKALRHFYDTLDGEGMARIKADPLYDTVEKEKAKNVSFLIAGDTAIVASKRELLTQDDTPDKAEDTICLVTGERGEAIKVASATPIAGGKSAGKLVAFQVNSGYDSYGKSQCGNAPISKEAEFCFSSALLRLLSKESRNKFIIGSRTFVFWASSDSEAALAAEQMFSEALAPGYDDDDEKEDNPNEGIERVTDTFKSIFSGKLASGLDDRFYVLGLAPAIARISVVYWHDAPLREFAANILKHFNDMEIVDRRSVKKPYAGYYQILAAVTPKGKTSDVLPSLPEAVIKSILYGTPYPVSLVRNCIARIHAEAADKDRDPVTITRAAIIKAYLTRTSNNNQKPTVMLNKDNRNAGYLCGRLVAVLNKIQYEASGASSLRTRYLVTASTTPGTVVPSMLRLSLFHIEKIQNKRHRDFLDSLKDEIYDTLDGCFPARLDLHDQNEFWAGYHQQKSDLKKETK